jgi:outer membrane protein TolC
MGILFLAGCSTAGRYRETIDKTAAQIIEQKQMEALGRIEPFTIEKPEEILRKKLILGQDLLYSSPASLGVKEIEPIPHWPNDDYLSSGKTDADATISYSSEPIKLTLIDALQIAAKNSRQYQSQKENVFRAALNLDLARDRFRNTFNGSVENTLGADLSRADTSSSFSNSVVGNFSRRLLNGVSLSARIGFDILKLLAPNSSTTKGFFGDASISIPLLRGAGRHIVAEPLTQSERDAVYAIYTFERYKRTFAVSIAQSYLSVLQQIDQINNADQNYRRLVLTTRQIRRQGDAGLKSPVEVDQGIQDEYSARLSWIGAQFSYQQVLDNFKVTLGLPPDAHIELDENELQSLAESVKKTINLDQEIRIDEEIPPADAPIDLPQISRENVGPMELDENYAIRLAFENRLDLRTAQGNVYDAQRAVVIAADNLRAELTLVGRANNNDDLNFHKASYNALLTLDLPIERTAEIVSYRNSLISLERAVRDLQDLEDGIKLDIRSQLRDMLESRENLQIAAQSVTLADRRVKSMNLYLEWGQRQIRDLLEAQRALLQSQNSLTRAIVNYRMAELRLQSDLGVLQVDENGLWTEFSPGGVTHDNESE